MVPSHIQTIIRAKAASDWPGDYSMQAHVIQQQTESYEKMENFRRHLDMSNQVVAQAMKKAATDWPTDFDMQVHVFEGQTEAAISFFNAEFPGVPQHIIDDIRTRSFAEWTDDYEMMLHTLNEQVSAWRTIYA